MRLAVLRSLGAALAAFSVLTVLPAAAEEPVETAIRAWIASIDASPDWQASYGALVVDPASGRATLAELSVASETPGFGVSFKTVTVQGYRATGDGTFAATSIDLLGGAISAGAYAVAIPGATIDGLVLPTGGGFAWDQAKPTASLAKVLTALSGASATGAHIGSMDIVETIGTVQTRTTYQNIKVDSWQDGKIAAISAGPLRTDSPARTDSGPPPLVTMTVASAETRDIDLGAMIAVYDPDRYAGGAGDGVWRAAVGHVVYRNIGIDLLGIGITIGGASFDDFRMRQLKTPPDFAPGDPAAAPSPADTLRGLSVYGVGRFALRDLAIDAGGGTRVRLGNLALVEASTDSIGSFTLENIEGASTAKGTVKVGRFAVGGLVLPPIEAITAAIAARSSGADVDLSSLVPPIGFVEAAGVNVAIAALPPVQLGRFRLDLGNYVGRVPTTITLALAGVDVPVAMIPLDRALRLLADFGYDRVRIDGSARVEWSAAGEITVRDFGLAMKDIGGISGEADLFGLTPADAEHLAGLTSALDKLSLKRGTIAFKDDSIVGRVLNAQATRLGTDPAKFREQFAKGLPFMLLFLGDKALQAQIAPVLQTFIRTPGTISATASPATPVALATLIEAARTAPFSLFGMLSINVSGTAGPVPAETPPTGPIRGTTPAD